MKKNIMRIFAMICFAVFISGCRTPDVQVRSYIENRERVDQEIDGNAGYIFGSPKEEDLEKGKPTRQMFVVEVTKEANEIADKEYVIIDDIDATQEPERAFKKPAQKKRKASPQKKLELPSFDAMVGDSPESKNDTNIKYVDYVVEKNDTLQKISKKFYDSYSKWPKIYEINKAVIDNPDSIKPGITIKVPVQK